MKRFFYFFLSFCLLFPGCKKKEATLFESIEPEVSGIYFANLLKETEQANILTYEYFYNGGGVAAGDVNNDGLVDLFFTGNQVDNKLYLNKGGLTFEDISDQAKITGRKGAWKTGVSLVDINADGWLDIYVCYSGPFPPATRRNQLFINTTPLTAGKEVRGTVTFREEAEAYGLADAGYSTQAAFFDYDADGDLDAFVLNHNLRGYQRQEAHTMRTARDEYAGDKLYRNDKGKFLEMSGQAGIKSNPLGFGLGVGVADLNGDNRPDLYVSNDYVEDDYLYINQGNGTFKDVLREKMSHTSRFSMGVAIADVNNDTLPDVFTLDMLPEDNLRQKLLTFPDNWNTYQSTLNNGFWHQHMRNMLQINEGNGSFSEIGQLAGVSNTDWSWSALLADFDNDGYKDLFVSNGELRDLTNSDFIKYSADEEMKKASGHPTEALLEQIKKMPSSETRNYIFKNLSGQQFENEQKAWGFDEPAVANGAVHADLDNDGDVDIVTNTNNGTARLYRNNRRASGEQPDREGNPAEAVGSNYLKMKLKGPVNNPFGVGAKVWVYGKDDKQYQEFSPVQGFQSCIYDALHVGLGEQNQSVKVKVVWPDGRRQELLEVKPNQTIDLEYAKASHSDNSPAPVPALFHEADSGVSPFVHRENYANDFARQILLPYMYSYSGARMAKGDVNGDGLVDLYVGGARNQAGQLLMQRRNGTFVAQPKGTGTLAFQTDSTYEDKDAVFFDADKDNDLDLYVVSGDFGLPRDSPAQQDRLYFNKGKGLDGNPTFERAQTALPEERINGSCVKVLDADRDGDSDLFVGTTAVPGLFPLAEPSFLLLNDGKGRFTRGATYFLGLVSDAVVADLDKNGFPDLVVVAEWLSPTVLYNRNGHFQNAELNIQHPLNGWWNRIAADDLDGDGDLDFVLGNLGLNCQMKASVKEPITLTYADFDKNGTLDPLMAYYIHGVAYPAAGRDELLEQVVSLRKKYTSYELFSKATMADLLPPEQLQSAQRFQIDFTETVVLENTGSGFFLHRLPLQAQYSPVYAISIGDFNEDGKKDILLGGNNATYRLRIGKMDANNGILLTGQGNFRYQYVPQAQSGFHLRGDVKDIQRVNDQTLVFFVNNGPVKVYVQSKREASAIP